MSILAKRLWSLLAQFAGLTSTASVIFTFCWLAFNSQRLRLSRQGLQQPASTRANVLESLLICWARHQQPVCSLLRASQLAIKYK